MLNSEELKKLLNINKISNKIIRDKIEVLCNEGVEKFIQILIDTETEKNNAKNAFTKAINEKNELEKENEILRKHVDKKLDIKNIEIDKLKKKCDKIEKEKAELLKKIKELEKYSLEKEKEKNTIIKTGNEKTKELEKELEKTNFQVKKLKNSMSKDVTTSNWSSGSKKYAFRKKTKNQVVNSREPSGKKTGGQVGHPLNIGTVSDTADSIEEILNSAVLPNWGIIDYEKNTVTQQVTDLVIKTNITKKIYTFTNGVNVKNLRLVKCANRYGNMVDLFIVASMQLEMNTYQRLPEFLSILTNDQINISQGYINKTILNFNYLLKDQIEWIIKKIKEAKYINFDESMLWMLLEKITVQGFCTKTETLLLPCLKKCDCKIIEFLNSCVNHPCIVVDYCKFYQQYKGKIAQCWAHIMRYLKAQETIYNVPEAKKIADLTWEIKKKRDADISSITELDIENYENEVTSLCDLFIDRYEKLDKIGKDYYKDGKNLFKRMKKLIKQHSAFLTDINIDFTNNEAERCFRMIKSKQNISCQFRNMKNVEAFLNIRSYIQTCKKRKINLNWSLRAVFNGVNVFTA